MSAVTLFELNRLRIVATTVDGKLRLSAPAGRLTADLRERIASDRDALLRALKVRANLLALAEMEGVDASHVHRLQDDDLAVCEGLADDTLRAYLRALASHERMDKGLPPLEWGEVLARTCEGCGPVLLWASCPAVLKACPWCFRRKAGKRLACPASSKEGHRYG